MSWRETHPKVVRTVEHVLAFIGSLIYVWIWAAIITLAVLCLMGLIGCAVTPKAALRREAESRVRGCMTGTRCTQTQACVAESVEWCKAHGMEVSCGVDGAFVDPVVCP